jgi:Na+-driven multidrug efflux pump
VGDFVSYIGQALAVILLIHRSASPLLAVFAIMAATSVLGAGIQILQLKLASRDLLPLEGYLASAWTMGRWWFFGRLVGVFTVQAFPWILAYGHGASSAGTYQALITILAVTNPVLFSLNNLVLTSVSRARAKEGNEAARRTAIRCASQSCVLLLPYFVTLLLFPGVLVRIFYGSHSVYMQFDGLLRIVVVAYAMETIACVSGAALGGLERTAYVFVSQFLGASVAIAGCLPAALRWGVPAAVAGLAIVNAVRAATNTYFVLRFTRHDGYLRPRVLTEVMSSVE